MVGCFRRCDRVTSGGDIPELGIAIRMLTPLARLHVALGGCSPTGAASSATTVWLTWCPRACKRDRQRPHTLARPTQRRVWIAGRRRLHQRVQILQQRLRRPLSPACDPRQVGASVPAGAARARRVHAAHAGSSTREIPVARSTAAMPPWPRARASVAAHTRLDRSVNTGANAACLARSVANGTRHRTTTPCR